MTIGIKLTMRPNGKLVSDTKLMVNSGWTISKISFMNLRKLVFIKQNIIRREHLPGRHKELT